MEVRRVVSFGKLTCPFLVNLTHTETVKVITGEEINKHNQKIPIYTLFVKNGTMDICSHPDDLIKGGITFKAKAQYLW